MNISLLKNVEKDINQHFGIDNCKLTYKDEIQLIIVGFDENMEEIVQYCKIQLETVFGQTYILHHGQSWEKDPSEDKTHLYRFIQKEE